MGSTANILQIVLLVVLLLGSGFFSASETSLMSLSKIRIRYMEDEGVKGAKLVGSLIEKSSDLLSSILVGNNIVNIAATSVSTSLFINIFGDGGVAIATAVMTVLVLVFGEITPKTIAANSPEKVAVVVSKPISIIMKITKPIVWVFNLLTGIIFKIMGIDNDGVKPFITEEELKAMVNVSHEEGVLEMEEREIINNVFQFGDMQAKEAMIQRLDMVAIDIEDSYDEIIELFKSEKLSRLPVYQESIDDIVGILNIKDIIFLSDEEIENFDIKDYVREAFFTYEFKKITQLLEEMKKENHVYSAAYRDDEIEEIMNICDHVVFNSFNQWVKYKELAKKMNTSCGIRINPECSTQVGHEIYDPCAKYSRMGITLENFKEDLLDGIEGLHFHTLCEQNSDDLVTTIKVVEEKFGKYLYQMKWLNFGGGHHITRDDYDLETLINVINEIKEKYQVQVYLEPGEAGALNAGFLVSSVLDIINNGIDIAIMDTSAACHMPDVLEMPYRPDIIDSDKPGVKKYTYRLGGPTCLAGDVISDYSFDQPLKIGQQLWFKDMAIYSMVKNNTFNGMNLPSIVLKQGDKLKVIREFGYDDFKNRLS